MPETCGASSDAATPTLSLSVAVLAAGAYAWHAEFASRLMGASVAEDKLATAPRLSIVVLPFENLSGDKEQDYFADGITDDLTTDLSQLPDSFVIARGTAFTYKGKPGDAKQIGRELGVRYVLEGSVRRVGETITINAQLISTETGARVWADRFDGERSRLGQLQVEFVAQLANSLGVEVVKAEALRAMRERPNNLDAVDLAMRGQAKVYSSKPDKAALNDGIALFERALSLDAQNVPAMIGLAGSLNGRAINYWSEDRESDIARAKATITRALALQPDNSSAHEVKAWVFYLKRQWASAIAEAEAAIVNDHNNADAIASASFWKVFLGRSENGFAGVESAIRLSPRDWNVTFWTLRRAGARLGLRSLNNPPAADAPVLHNAESPVLLAVLPPNLRAQKHEPLAKFIERGEFSQCWRGGAAGAQAGAGLSCVTRSI